MPRYPSGDDFRERWSTVCSVTCTIRNQTRHIWYWEDFLLQEYTNFNSAHGRNKVKRELKPGEQTTLSFCSQRTLGGTEARVTYNTAAGPLEFHWDVPNGNHFAGNSYHTYKLPEEFVSVHNSAPGRWRLDKRIDPDEDDKVADQDIKGFNPRFEWTIRQREDAELTTTSRRVIDHFYTTDPSGEVAGQNGYKPEGIAGYVYPNNKSLPNTVAFYRFYNRITGDHFYTQREDGEGGPDYNYEGLACYLPSIKDKSATEFNRLWGNLNHFYTLNADYEGSTSAGYTNEGAAGYIYRNQEDDTIPLYRWLSS